MADYDGGEHAAPPPEEQPKRERSQRRERRKNKWGDGADAADQEKAPEWVQELFDGPSNKLANVWRGLFRVVLVMSGEGRG